MTRCPVACLLLACLPVFSQLAGAVELRVGGGPGAAAMRLTYGDGWQRGDAADEAELDSHVLAGEGLVLYLPRTPVALKVPAAVFHDQLEHKWRSQFGRHAVIEWIRHGGQDWHLCRRPSQEGGATVFHMVTVAGDKAYTLLWVLAGTAEELPAAARQLMEGLAFAGDPLPGGWRRVFGQVVVAGGSEQETGVQADLVHLGERGRVTGYGLEHDARSLAWHLQGELQLDAGGGTARRPFALNRRLSWQDPPERLPLVGSVQLSLALDAAGADPLQGGVPGVAVELRVLCLSGDSLHRLRQGMPWTALQGLDSQCPLSAASREGFPGDVPGPANLSLELPVPEVPQGLDAANAPLLLVSLRPLPAAAPALGSGLLGGSVAYYLYERVSGP